LQVKRNLGKHGAYARVTEDQEEHGEHDEKTRHGGSSARGMDRTGDGQPFGGEENREPAEALDQSPLARQGRRTVQKSTYFLRRERKSTKPEAIKARALPPEAGSISGAGTAAATAVEPTTSKHRAVSFRILFL